MSLNNFNIYRQQIKYPTISEFKGAPRNSFKLIGRYENSDLIPNEIIQKAIDDGIVNKATRYIVTMDIHDESGFGWEFENNYGWEYEVEQVIEPRFRVV